MDRSMIMWGSAFVAGSVVFSIWYAMESGAAATASEKISEVAEMFSTQPQPVMVFMMPPPTIAAVAEVIDEEDLVFEGPEALAYRSSGAGDARRVLAKDRVAASAAVNGAGWAEHPIEIVSIAQRKRPGQSGKKGGDPGDPATDDLSDLYAKSSLSRGEAIRVMRALQAQP